LKTEDILKELKNRGVSWRKGVDPRTSFASHLIYCDDFAGRPSYFIGGEVSPQNRIDALIDALYLHLGSSSDNEVTSPQLIVGRGENHDEVIDALSVLVRTLRPKVELNLMVDFEVYNVSDSTDLSDHDGITSRLEHLQSQSQSPELLALISKQVNNELLSWSRSTIDGKWHGRIDGLDVCQIDAQGNGLLLSKGEPRACRLVRDALQDVEGIEHGESFGPPQLDQVVNGLNAVLHARETGGLKECALHDRVRYRVVNGRSKVGKLDSICADFPTLWGNNSQTAHNAHMLMRQETTPWVVQIEVGTGGRIEDSFRRAIGHAVLHREFIRRAAKLRSWFAERGLDAENCQAAVAFPKLTSARGRSRLGDLQDLGTLFDLEIIPIRGSIV